MDIHGVITGYRKDRNAILKFEQSLRRMEHYDIDVSAIRTQCFDVLANLQTRAAKTVADCLVNDKLCDTVAVVRQLLDNY